MLCDPLTRWSLCSCVLLPMDRKNSFCFVFSLSHSLSLSPFLSFTCFRLCGKCMLLVTMFFLFFLSISPASKRREIERERERKRKRERKRERERSPFLSFDRRCSANATLTLQQQPHTCSTSTRSTEQYTNRVEEWNRKRGAIVLVQAKAFLLKRMADGKCVQCKYISCRNEQIAMQT